MPKHPQPSEDQQVRAARRGVVWAFALTCALMTGVSVAGMLLEWPGWGFAAPLLALLATALVTHVLRFLRFLGRPGAPASAPYVAFAATVGLALCVLGGASSWLGWLWVAMPALLLGDIVTARPRRVVVSWVAGAVVAVLALGLAFGARPASWSTLPWWSCAAIAAAYLGFMWTCDIERNWWLRAMVRLDESRRMAAELATTRERLRLADDLHDILGHALEVVAFKSELAGRMLPGGAEDARREMDEVQRVAREAMSDVRALARDRKPTDLATELVGARAVLDSAEIRMDVVGEPEEVDASAQDPLGRVLREAMTNLLRHADPTYAAVTITVAGGARPVATLRVRNDGALAPEPGARRGTGLETAARRLAQRSGSLRTETGADGTFTLEASLPLPASTAAEPLGTAVAANP